MSKTSTNGTTKPTPPNWHAKFRAAEKELRSLRDQLGIAGESVRHLSRWNLHRQQVEASVEELNGTYDRLVEELTKPWWRRDRLLIERLRLQAAVQRARVKSRRADPPRDGQPYDEPGSIGGLQQRIPDIAAAPDKGGNSVTVEDCFVEQSVAGPYQAFTGVKHPPQVAVDANAKTRLSEALVHLPKKDGAK